MHLSEMGIKLQVCFGSWHKLHNQNLSFSYPFLGSAFWPWLYFVNTHGNELPISISEISVYGKKSKDF